MNQVAKYGRARAQALGVRPFLISFSGIDGAGKSTQIDYLKTYLESRGLRVLLLTFWDNVAVFSKIRGGVGQRTDPVPQSTQSKSDAFVPRNDKHIRKWYLSTARAGFYVLDVVRLHRLLANPQIESYDVVIFDRYVYDQIANIYSKSSIARLYSKLLLKQTPAPDLAFIIDANPDAAFARKPEYPLDFVHKNQQNFLNLRELVPQLLVISPDTPENVRSEIEMHIRRSQVVRPAPRNPAPSKGITEFVGSDPVVPQRTSCSPQNDPTTTV
jgi:thymidylate kinase